MIRSHFTRFCSFFSVFIRIRARPSACPDSAQICVVAPIGGVDRWTLLSRALCLGSTDTQSTADMGRPPRGTSAHFFCTVSAACAVCLPVLCVCDVCVCAGYVSQHTALVLTSHHLVPTLQHLVLSRTISHQSPQHLVPVSHTDLAASCAIGANLARCHVQTFHHLDRSPPSQVF